MAGVLGAKLGSMACRAGSHQPGPSCTVHGQGKQGRPRGGGQAQLRVQIICLWGWGRWRSGWEGKPQTWVRIRASRWWTRQGGHNWASIHGSGSGLMESMARHRLGWAGDPYSSAVAHAGTEGWAEMDLLSQWQGTWWRAEVSLFRAIKRLFSTLRTPTLCSRMLLDCKLSSSSRMAILTSSSVQLTGSGAAGILLVCVCTLWIPPFLLREDLIQLSTALESVTV